MNNPPARFGSDRRSIAALATGHPAGYGSLMHSKERTDQLGRAQKVPLSNLDTRTTQQRVGGRDMKIEIRQSPLE